MNGRHSRSDVLRHGGAHDTSAIDVLRAELARGVVRAGVGSDDERGEDTLLHPDDCRDVFGEGCPPGEKLSSLLHECRSGPPTG